MGFESSYTKEVKKSESSKLPKEGSTILPFLGYSYEEKSDSVFRRVDRGYSVTPNGDSYTVEKNRDVIDRTDYESVTFYRDTEPSDEIKKIEDEIYSIFEKKYTSKDALGRKFDVYKTPHLLNSCSSYYKKSACPFKLIDGFFLLLLLVCAIGFIEGCVESSSSIALGSIGIGIVVMCIFGAIIGHREEKFFRDHPFGGLTEEEKEQWRKKYINSLTVHDDECDELLRKYAILRGYDKQ